ncbi:MAG: phosphatase family protein [Segetibacter sp.]|nr:phosphatase family protein [Segetibacter sp.]
MKCFYLFLFSFFLICSASAQLNKKWKLKSENPEFLHRSIKQVTDVIVHDIYSPPVASRTYAYITIAGYEASVQSDPAYISFAEQLHDLTPVPTPPKDKELSYSLAAAHAILLVGKAMVISEEKILDFDKKLLLEFKKLGVPEPVFRNSVSYGKMVADHILAWASKDNYKQTRSFPKYDVNDNEDSWKPTPPAYIKAIEPHWSKIRPFIIDSAGQFKPDPPTSFSSAKNSRFYKEAEDVREIGLKLTPEQKEVANFWDCNPFKMNIKGHVMFATKKISPGGHWINITRLACRKAKAGLVQAAAAYACVSVTLADGFISCWDEKYRSNVIRPETYINQFIDESWVPLLQTPPFPEYTSGHSVISTASAIMLTKIFGEKFSYADSTEIEFGLPVRNFKSFNDAAEEAAISRFYGGIHYMPAIKNGMEEGTKIGRFISDKLIVFKPPGEAKRK